MVGLTFNFETVDVDGNKVTSEELFGKNEVTMVNYWGTWCGPCRGELAELGEINERLADKGCGIIGIVEDAVADDQETLKAAKDLLTENKVGYVNLVPNKDMAEILDQVTAYPTSFFVDKTGKILCTPIEGAAVEEYEKTIDALLKGEEKITRSAASSSAPMTCATWPRPTPTALRPSTWTREWNTRFTCSRFLPAMRRTPVST